MWAPPVDPRAPNRKELPCEFRPTGPARNQALAQAALFAVLGVAFLGVAVAGTIKGGAGARLLCGALGVAALVGAWFLADAAYTSVRMDDEGLLVRRPGRAKRLRWSQMTRVSFGAKNKNRNRGGRGAAAFVARAVSDYLDTDARGDPYVEGRVRENYEPSATVTASGGRAHLTDALGWSFFLALHAEAQARGVQVVRS